MEKVYLLLRKNQQTGPYTYEELLQQHLQPTDLIWVDGKSTTWLSPAELKVFKATHTKGQKASPEAVTPPGKPAPPQQTTDDIPWYHKKRSPEAELEERALANRERARSTANIAYRPSIPASHSRHRKHTVYQEEESPVLVEIHTLHKKHVSLPQLIAAGVITALVATGWYNREVLNIVRSPQTEVSQAAAPVTFQVTLPPTLKPVAVPVVDTESIQRQDTVLPTSIASSSLAVQQKKTVQIEVKEATIQEPIEKPTLVQTSTTEKKEEAVDTAASTAKVENKEAVDTTLGQTENTTTVDQAAPPKKKGLGQAIKNIFKKKKKGNEIEETDKAAVD